MPKTLTLNYVHELPWKATCRGTVKIDNLLYTRAEIGAWEIEKVHRINGVVVFFSQECREKLLAAMGNFGKAEEFSASHSRCLLELRAEIEALKKK